MLMTGLFGNNATLYIATGEIGVSPELQLNKQLQLINAPDLNNPADLSLTISGRF